MADVAVVQGGAWMRAVGGAVSREINLATSRKISRNSAAAARERMWIPFRLGPKEKDQCVEE